MPLSEQEFLASYPQKVAPGSPTGHPGNLLPEQEAKLAEFRAYLIAEGYTDRTDDATLLRFLRARKFNVQQAKEMWVACEKWRQEFGVNTILDDFWYKEKKEVAKLYPQYYHKTDKDGRPVYVEHVGSVMINEMYKITTQERMLRNLVWEYESFVRHRLPACSRMMGYLVETSCTILDLKGVSLTSASQVYGFLKEASYIGQNYYPERMGKFYLINAPFGFSTVFAVIKRFLDPVTVSKIHVYGSSYKEKLLLQIPESHLPVEFGGTSTSEISVELTDDGPWRNEKYVGPEGLAPIAGKKPPGFCKPLSYNMIQSTQFTETTNEKAPIIYPSSVASVCNGVDLGPPVESTTSTIVHDTEDIIDITVVKENSYTNQTTFTSTMQTSHSGTNSAKTISINVPSSKNHTI